jgi:hypothetical protein
MYIQDGKISLEEFIAFFTEELADIPEDKADEFLGKFTKWVDGMKARDTARDTAEQLPYGSFVQPPPE